MNSGEDLKSKIRTVEAYSEGINASVLHSLSPTMKIDSGKVSTVLTKVIENRIGPMTLPQIPERIDQAPRSLPASVSFLIRFKARDAIAAPPPPPKLERA